MRSARVVGSLGAASIGLTSLVAIAAVPDDSPLSENPLSGVTAPPFLQTLARALAVEEASPRLLMTLGLALLLLLALTFFSSLRAAWTNVMSPTFAISVGLALHIILIPVPSLFSHDVNSYVMYGRIASLHEDNPYVTPPEDFPDDAFGQEVGYRDATSVYGPAFTALSVGITELQPSIPDAIRIFHSLAIAASAAAMLLCAAAMRRVSPDRVAFAAVLVGWNPVVLLHSTGGAHNDSLLLLAGAAATFFIVTKRNVAATVAVALGALVKGVFLFPLLVAVAGFVAMSGNRARALAIHCAAIAAVAAPFMIPFWSAENPTFGALSAASRFALGSDLVRTIAQGIGLDAIAEPLATFAQGAGPFVIIATTVAVIAYLLRRSGVADQDTVLGGMAVVLLVAFLFTDMHWPWYGVWFLPFVASASPAVRTATVVTSLALTIGHPWASTVGVDPWIKGSLFLTLGVVAIVLLALVVELTVNFAGVVGRERQRDNLGFLLHPLTRVGLSLWPETSAGSAPSAAEGLPDGPSDQGPREPDPGPGVTQPQ